jgi:hypothetical protein
MVEGARPSDVAIERIEWPATTARDTSSRSTKVSANLERHRCAGRIPPVSAKIRCMDEWFRSTTLRSSEEIRPSASDPTSQLSGFPCNKSGAFASSATLLLLTQLQVCCIHRLNPQPQAAAPWSRFMAAKPTLNRSRLHVVATVGMAKNKMLLPPIEFVQLHMKEMKHLRRWVGPACVAERPMSSMKHYGNLQRNRAAAQALATQPL